MKQVESFSPARLSACAISGDRVMSSPTLYQIGTPIRMQARYFSARRRLENNSVNEPRFVPAPANCGKVASPSRSPAGRAAGNPPCPRRGRPVAREEVARQPCGYCP